MMYLSAKQQGVFTYYGHSYTLEPITPPQVNLRNILVIGYPLDLKICQDNPDTMQNIFFEAERLPGYPKPLTVPPRELPAGSRLMLLRGGGIGDILMLAPALKYLRKAVGNRITIKLSTFAERIPIIEGLGCIDTFFPHPIRLYDLINESDYYMDFSDPKRIFNDTDMIDFYLDSLFFDPASIPAQDKIPQLSDHLKRSGRIIESMETLNPDRKTRVLFAGNASSPIRHLPPFILKFLSASYPDMVFLVPSDRTGPSVEALNIFHLDTSGGLTDFVTAINLCDIVVSSDSSAYHIAAAVGTPALVFFGPIGSKIRIGNYPKVVALDSEYSGLTCHAPCGISALQETPPTIGIGANNIKNLDSGVEIVTFDGRTFKFDPKKGCPESNAALTTHSPCMSCFSEADIIKGFEKTLSLMEPVRRD